MGHKIEAGEIAHDGDDIGHHSSLAGDELQHRALAGAVSALVYKLFIFITKNKQTMSAVFASIATPVVNTGLYLIGMVFLFKNYLIGQLGVSDNVTGSSLILVVIGIIWVNFIIEFILNVVICPIISSSLLKNGKIKRIR